MTDATEHQVPAANAAHTTRRDPARAASTPAPLVRIYGCGRSLRRDDQIGLRVAELLASDTPPRTSIQTTEAPGAELLCNLEGVELLIIADAAETQERFPLGSWARIVYAGSDDHQRTAGLKVPDSWAARPDTHTLNVNDALTLAKQLNTLPPEVWIYVVAGRDFSYGESLSPGVEPAIRTVTERVRADLAAWLGRSARVYAHRHNSATRD